jgi:hypothetical protein
MVKVSWIKDIQDLEASEIRLKYFAIFWDAKQYKLFESQSINDLEEIDHQISWSQGYEFSNEERERKSRDWEKEILFK